MIDVVRRPDVKASGWAYNPIKKVDLLVVHCSATKATQDFNAKTIDGWHRQQGWKCIGYHYVIRRDGVVEKGREDDCPGAHAEQVNSHSLGICLIGGIAANGNPEANFTEPQYLALHLLLSALHAKYPEAQVVGHRDIPGVHKACPSFDVRDWLTTHPLDIT